MDWLQVRNFLSCGSGNFRNTHVNSSIAGKRQSQYSTPQILGNFQVLALNLSLILTFMKIKIQFVSSDLTRESYS